MNHSAAKSRHSGFTLLELVMAMLLLTILIGMVFGTARTSLALGNSVVKSQNEEMLHQAFFELLSKRFAALPGNTRFDLQVQGAGGQYLSDLTLQNVPLSFTWGGQPRIAKTVQLSTVRRRSGFLSIVLRYYENEILEGSAAPDAGKSIIDNKPFAEVELLKDVAYFEWRVLDGTSLEWQYDWDIQGRLPLQLELTVAFGAQGEEIRQIFWIPPKQNPEVALRQILQSGGTTTTTPTTPKPGSITIPAGTIPGGGGGGAGGGRGGPGGGRGGGGGGGGGG
ncbi:MAG: prepilin-type N-terminal cleavage/methylation domain-containing protein, partial [Verrucomicrobiota bacterium]